MNQMSPAETASEETLAKLRSCINNNRCFRLEAGAGAGKTYSLIESIKYLINKKSSEYLLNEQQIACITYTNVAKGEIKDRTDNHPVIFADTIHAFSWSILQHYQVKLRELIPELGEKWVKRVEEAGGIINQEVRYDLGFANINDNSITLHHDDVIALMGKLLAYPKFQKLLKNRFPVIFIDEYQDTDAQLAQSIVNNLIDNKSGIIIGLFGDHWQKIYGSSACGLIESNANLLEEIGKKANFRSDKNIVDCLNRMRPELPQAESNPLSAGVIKVYHSNEWQGTRRTGGHWKGDLPEVDVKEYIEKVKLLLEEDGWDMRPEKTKILFLTNNLIASEQQFKNLASCFTYTDDYLKKADKYIKYFLDIVEPVSFAFEQRNYGELFQIVNQGHLRLASQTDKKVWATNLEKLIKVRDTGTIGELMELLRETKTPRLPMKVYESEKRYDEIQDREKSNDLSDEDKRFYNKLHKIKEVSYKEVKNLGEYIDEKTPFSTKHGVKGAQFDNVLVVLGRGWNHYNWNQMLEWMNQAPPQDKVNTYERNRNLFYVSCSRAKHNLTLLFTQELSDDALAQIEYVAGADNLIGNPF
ncbi:UvrD-helicase domain-containing protein [Pseudoalteromonas sp. 1_2015MBL_MicDiv]|uniref:UvrD-helicase domain-containing protein n=1 Tax=Pseudoalteromonas sp. 1_2015MBL_MicDiv TaxID=1720343 RepID=UPI000BBEF205|nr:UvrD-helicase domain-containing protein [Pseudoalteromonas sp. 1_2015MBL_MicDiv]ATG76316.1 DNA helicase II [Pseudoalteromonas sp. 1_2015MBL_MicDiv]